MAGKVLVLGASGLFGARAAEAFTAANWEVHRYQRGTVMVAAARGMDVIVNGLNPPMYHDWARLVPAITAEVIVAAKASGATVIVPGNVYVYGDQPGPWNAATPHRPVSRKGVIRAQMEADYRASGARVIILRGGDFLDAKVTRSFLNMLVLKHLVKGKIEILGAPDVTRAYALLPDMARAAVELAAMRADLPVFADIPFSGLAFSMENLKIEIERQTGRNHRFVRFPWWLLRLTAPFWELAREFPEMRYLFDTPHRLDPAPLARLLPEFRMANLSEVVAAHLLAQGIAISTQTGR